MDFPFPTGRDDLPPCPKRRLGPTIHRPITSIISAFHQAPLGGGGEGPKPVIPSRPSPPFPLAAIEQDDTWVAPLEIYND